MEINKNPLSLSSPWTPSPSPLSGRKHPTVKPSGMTSQRQSIRPDRYVNNLFEKKSTIVENDQGKALSETGVGRLIPNSCHHTPHMYYDFILYERGDGALFLDDRSRIGRPHASSIANLPCLESASMSPIGSWKLRP